MVISNDSTYQLYNEEKHVYETRKLTFATDSTFQHFINEFIPISTSNKGTFFIHNACGVVYHFIGDSIYRHDQSFYHKNQYGGVVFEQNNEIFMYGGYGMFTEKNILVHYNPIMREWINVNYINTPPVEVYLPIVVNNSNDIYFLGGLNRFRKLSEENAYSFNILTKKWHLLGTTTAAFQQLIRTNLIHTTWRFKHVASILKDRIIQLDVTNNKFSIVHSKIKGAVKSIQVQPNDNNLIQVHFERTGVKSHFVQVMQLEDLLGAQIQTGNIWEEPRKKWLAIKYWQQLSAFLIGLLLMWFVLFVNNREKAKRSNTIRIDFKKIDLQDPQFIAMQTLFLTAPEHTVEVSAINSIVEEEGVTPDTIKKRRERLIRDFTNAIAIQTGLAPTEIFLEMRHPKDKRIKLLKLSNKLITNE